MKIYICKLCKQRGRKFTGIRPAVRKHLRVEHLIRGKRRDILGKVQPSELTKNTLSEEI